MIRIVLSTVGICVGLTLLFGVANFLWLVPHGFSDYQGVTDFGRPLLMSASLLLGIYFKALYDELQSTSSDRIEISSVLKRSWRSRQFWMALTVSPIVLLSFLPSVDAITSNVLLALVCFENGFFFRSIFNKREQVHTDAHSEKV